MKKILIYANYYYPDVASTGQIYTDLAEGLVNYGFDVTVICAVPCYTGHIDKKYLESKQRFFPEDYHGVHIVRVKVPEFDKQNKASRVKHILAYYQNAKKATKKLGNFDYILTVSQPPVLGGMLGVYGKEKKKAKLIYNIQDFNPEQIMATHYSGNKALIDVLMKLDKKSCLKSDLVITVGRDLVNNLNKRFENSKKKPKSVFINNWIDEKQVYPLSSDNEGVVAFKEKYGLTNKFVFMYSGNIGLYYDLDGVFKVIEKIKPGTRAADGREVVFAFVGAGAMLEKLEAYKAEHHMDNVVFIPYQDKEKIIYSLNAADVHLCLSAKGIKGVSCPSKYYGIAACAKPVLGVMEEGSEIRSIIEECNSGRCVDPEDYQGIKNLIHYFASDKASLKELGENGYQYQSTELTKEQSIKKYAENILSL